MARFQYSCFRCLAVEQEKGVRSQTRKRGQEPNWYSGQVPWALDLQQPVNCKRKKRWWLTMRITNAWFAISQFAYSLKLAPDPFDSSTAIGASLKFENLICVSRSKPKRIYKPNFSWLALFLPFFEDSNWQLFGISLVLVFFAKQRFEKRWLIWL